MVLYRGKALRRYQYYTATEWPGGLYLSPTLAGSRPGALSAACWAAMVAIGAQGYMEATRRILETAAEIKKGIAEVPEVRLLGDFRHGQREPPRLRKIAHNAATSMITESRHYD